MSDKEFYIGYLPKMPPKMAKAIRKAVILFFVIGLSFAAAVWFAQKPFARSFFEFDTVKDFEGTIQAGEGVPFLMVERGEKNNGMPTFERFPLVAEGKHGVGDNVTALDGQRVKLKGKLIYRNELRMIEVMADSVEKVAQTAQPISEKTEILGVQTLRGQIVDSKCYLGVMNPGQSKPHRDCAVACLRGGIPPLFIIKDEKENVSELWLLSDQGRPVNKEILDFVAEPIEISGEISRTGDQLFFKINPNQIKRVE